MKPKFRHLRSLVLASSALLAISSASADIRYWDGGTVDILTNGNGLSDGTAGTWNTSILNWDQGAGLAHVAWDNTDTLLNPADTAVFSGPAGTVTLTTPITVGGLHYKRTAYAITTGANTLSFGTGDNIILLDNTAAATITGIVGGAGNVILKASNPALGTGILTFTGASSGGWLGTTTINPSMILTTTSTSGNVNRVLDSTSGITLNGGRIQFNRATNANLNAISDTAAITVNGGGTFSVTSADAGGVNAIENIGAVTVNSGQMNFNWTNGASSGAQIIMSGLTTNGTSALTFSGNLGSTGRWKVTGAGTTAANEIIGSWATTGGANGIAAQTDYAAYSGDFVAAANIGASAQTTWLTATEAYTVSGGASLTGTRTIAALRAIGAAQTLALGANSLETTGILNGGSGLLTVSGTGALTTQTGGGNLFLTSGSNAITVSAPITDNAGAVTVVKSGNSALTLTGVNTHTGGTVLNAGSLTYTNDNQLGLAGSRNITINGTATLTGFDNSSLGQLSIGAGAIATITANNITFATATGSGTVAMTSGNKTLSLQNASSFQGNLRTFAGGNGQTIRFGSIGDDVGAGNLQYGGGSNDNNQTLTFQLYNNAGPQVFNNRSIEIFSKNQSAGTGTVANPTLQNTNSNAANTFIINTDLVNGSDRNNNFILGGANTGNNQFNGVIGDSTKGAFHTGNTGALRLTKADAGTWILGGANTYTGGTTVTAGTLKANSASALSTGNVTVTGGTLVIDAADAIADNAGLFLPSAATKNLTMNFNDTIGSLFLAGAQQPNGSYTSAGAGSAWMNTGSGILMVGSAAAQPIYWDLDNTTPGAGGATPTGTWNAGNTFWNNPAGDGTSAAWTPGATAAFSAGTNATGSYTVTVDGTHDIGGLTFEEGNVTLSGGTALRLVSASLASVASGLTATVSTSLTQDASARALTKIGAGTLILSGDNSFTGTTTLGAGTLQLAHTNAIGGSTSMNMATGTTLQLRSDTAATFNTPTIALPGGTANSLTINVDNTSSGTGNLLTLSSGLTLLNNTTGAVVTLNTTGGNGYSLSIPSLSITTSGGNNSGTATTLNPSVNTTIGTLTSTATTTDLLLNLGGAAGTVNTINTLTTVKPAAFNPTGNKNTAATWIVNNWTQVGGPFTMSAGTLTITGTLNVSGMVGGTRVFNVTGGTLNLNSTTALTNSASNFQIGGASLDNTFGSAITLSTNPNMTLAGDLTFIGTNGANSNLNLGTGAVAITGATRQVSVTNAASTLTVGGIISGTGFGVTKAGAGTLELGGLNSYTGATTVTNGTLLINGSTSVSSAVAVNGGTLGGTGTIGGAVSVADGATLSPGASIQSLATGALTMASNSTFVYEAMNNTAEGADLLGVSGALSLTGVNLDLTLANAALSGGGWIDGNKLTLISYILGGSEVTSGFTDYADDTSYIFGTNSWLFDYNDTTAGGNYGTDAVAAGQNRFVTMTVTVIPEPSSALLGALGALLLLRRRR